MTRPRKKLQMTTREIETISETLGGNLGVLVLAGGEPFTRKDLPEIARAFYTNNRLESVYITSNGQIQKRIFPDVARMLQECPRLNVTVALGIDGLQRAARQDSPETRIVGHRHRHGAPAPGHEEGISAPRRANLHLFHELEPGHDF